MKLCFYCPTGIWMYHVTKESALNIVLTFTSPPWTEIEPRSIANDKKYDGNLLGLPLASFTTTLYNGELPTVSPYPRGKSGWHYRVRVKFYKQNYHIFLMGEKYTQTSDTYQYQLLCIRKCDRDQFEEKVYRILLQCYEDQQLSDLTIKTYFPEGKANDAKHGKKMYVNVHFTHSINISDGHGEWDTVQTENDNIKVEKIFKDITKRDDLLSLWCMKQHLEAAANITKKFKTTNKSVIRTILKTHCQSALYSLTNLSVGENNENEKGDEDEENDEDVKALN